MQKEPMSRASKTVSRLIVPSLFFAAFFAIMAFSSVLTGVKLSAGATAITILINLYYRNAIATRLMGIVFLLGSFYFLLALADDYFDGEAVASNFIELSIIAASICMSVLMAMGPKFRNAQLSQIVANP